MKPQKKKPASPAQKQGAKKPAAPIVETEAPTGKPNPKESEIEEALALLKENRAESARFEQVRKAREKTWKGWTASKMFRTLEGESIRLAEMLEECRSRMWERKTKGEGSFWLNEALDQAARCFVDQLQATATFARHAYCFMFQDTPEGNEWREWMASEEGRKAEESARAEHPETKNFKLCKTPEGFKWVPADGEIAGKIAAVKKRTGKG